MKKKISHDWEDECIEAKAKWFRSLTLTERMETLCSFTDLAFEINPDIADRKDAEQTDRSILIVTKS